MKILYSTSATATGGREGRACSVDRRLDVKLDMPAELGGPGGDGTNPEQLFAAGYAACFESALRLCARQARVRVRELSITAAVDLAQTPAGGFQLAVELIGQTPDISVDELASLMAQAHAICPYSAATRDNITVKLSASALSGSALP
jgi:Ohr subfamily peroxiredoxin